MAAERLQIQIVDRLMDARDKTLDSVMNDMGKGDFSSSAYRLLALERQTMRLVITTGRMLVENGKIASGPTISLPQE